MEQSIIFVLAIGACFMLSYSFSRRIAYVKDVQKKQQQEHEEKCARYSNLTSIVFDQTPDDELVDAVKFHIMAKEDKLYEGEEIIGNLKDFLTPSELLVHTIFQVEASMEGGRGSIHTFFISEPYCTYRPYAIDAFKVVGDQAIVELMKKAQKLAEMIENDVEIDDSEFSEYNFADFTVELMSMMKSSDFNLEISKFIRKNKNDFIDMEVETND